MGGESTREREAFGAYWDLGADRSIERLHEGLKNGERAPSLRTLWRWSAKYDWQRRVRELEREARKADNDARIEALRHTEERQADLGLWMQQKGVESLDLRDPAKVTTQAAIRLLVEGSKMERTLRGVMTDRMDMMVTILNQMLKAIMEVFVIANVEDLPQDREFHFCQGMDDLMKKYSRELARPRT